MSMDATLSRDTASDAHAFYLQAAFRSLLDVMARPGEVAELPAPDREGPSDAGASGLTEPALVVADVLIDAATGFAVAGERAEEAERVLSRRTHAGTRSTADAPYAFLPATVRDDGAREFVLALPCGTLADPQLGATLVVECGTLLGLDARGGRCGSRSGAFPSSAWTLSGPGIKTTSTIACDRADVIEARLERADEFPCGIDIILVDGAGHVAAIPRTTAIAPVEGDIIEDREGSSWDM